LPIQPRHARDDRHGSRFAWTPTCCAKLDAIVQRRGLRQTRELAMQASAAPSAPDWQQRWERAVDALGVPLFRMPSGAGHDAMKLHEVMPQAMLFVRGLNAGISHNPLESSTNDDIELAVQAFQNLLDNLAAEQAPATP
jgi:N-carbamoyl-L-amino-acid hydrolase